MRELYYTLDLGMDPLLDMNLPTKVRHNRIPMNNVNPSLIEKLKKVNLFPANGAIFYSAPKFFTTISHVDCHIKDPSADWPSISKLNFIAGDKNTLTMWYDVPEDKRRLTFKSTTSIRQDYQSYKLYYCKNIETCSLSGWHLFEAGVPHTVANPTNNPKWTISFIMRDTVTYKWLNFAESKERLLAL